MPSNFDKKEIDPASRRPIMRDVLSRARKETPPKLPPAKEKPSEILRIARKEVRRIPPSPSALYWSLGAVGSFTVLVLLLSYFSYVLVKVGPREEWVDISSSVRASLASPRDLSLEVITFDETAERIGPVTTLKKIEERAKGRVAIFNSFSSEPQVLVSGTRLEAEGGKIYRLTSQITVPGAKVENGKIQPQGVEVEVRADKPGEEYNLGLSDFTIPGFKGTSKFDKFYGRSKTEISGGFVGTVPVVSEDDVKKITREIEGGLLAAFKERISKDLPEGIFLPDGAYEISTKLEGVNPPVNSRGDTVTVKVRGSLRGLAVKKSEIEQFLGRSYLGLSPGEEVEILNFKDLSVEVSNKNFEEKNLTLAVRGKAHFVWIFEEEALKSDLLEGVRGRELVFQKYPAIRRAQIEFKPFWWRIFPQNPERIRIEIILETQ